jgi:methionine-rich copper-binding protein CopC
MASAHASLVASSPADGQTVGGLMEQIDLVFNEAVNAPRVTVSGPDGANVDAVVTQPSPNHLRISLVSPLEVEGNYRVDYELISADEDPLSLALDFSYENAADPALPVVASVVVEAQGGGYTWIIVGGLTLVVVSLGWRFMRSRRALRQYR